MQTDTLFAYGPDNIIAIINDGYEYTDRAEAFGYDCSTIGLPLIPAKPSNIRNYFCTEDGRSGAITKEASQVDFKTAIGKEPSFFYQYIDNIFALLEAKHNRDGLVMGTNINVSP